MNEPRPLIFDPEHYPEDRQTLDQDGDKTNRELEARRNDAILASRVMKWKCVSGNFTFSGAPEGTECIVNLESKYPSVRVLIGEQSIEFAPHRCLVDAMHVLSKFNDWNICRDDDANVMGDSKFFCYIWLDNTQHQGYGLTIPQAICNAALNALGEQPVFVRQTVELEFMVVPDQLDSIAFVPNPVRCKIVNADSPHLSSYLGQSGKTLAKAGVEFYFKKSIADWLIKEGIAVQV